ncbi:hypothetical protein [Sphingorhabdus sp. 109]|jgi:hypothetical protein|uniref:hypothetical protein n=1 Tax=Sphingorhabdus sp. 109 TaxID=2653173 RepID=UPI0012F35011|nr:hypothetical protein [Sphingorhabdus sp. 109]VWX59783.1 conserved membrane hypothetical protein [Sphingorhabdus sp. 109]
MDFMIISFYQLLVFLHMILFVLWLGADVGVFMLGQHFRKREQYDLPQRLVLLRLLVSLDMVPRSAWALMVPLTLTMVDAGGWWDLPVWALVVAWAVGGGWLWLVWDAHRHDQTDRAARDRKIESLLTIGLTIFYLGLGLVSLALGSPLAPAWLATKALMFGLIFAAAIMIDLTFRPVGPQLGKLIAEGSSDETEIPLLATMNRTRIWVWIVYLLLLATAFLGNIKPY